MLKLSAMRRADCQDNHPNHYSTPNLPASPLSTLLSSFTSMLRRLSPFYFLAAGLLTAPLAPAQSSGDQPADPATPASTEQKHLSSHITAVLRDKLPAFTTVEAKQPDPSPSPEAAPDTVVLEKRIIHGTTRRTFTEHDLANQAGLTALLRKLYPGAVPVGSRLPNYAALMLSDDERLENIAELETTVKNLLVTGDVKASKDLKKEISRAFVRGHDWRTESLDRSFNNNRR